MAEGSSVEQLQHQETAVQLEVRGPPLSVTDRYYTKHYAVGKDLMDCSRQPGVVTGSRWEHILCLNCTDHALQWVELASDTPVKSGPVNVLERLSSILLVLLSVTALCFVLCKLESELLMTLYELGMRLV